MDVRFARLMMALTLAAAYLVAVPPVAAEAQPSPSAYALYASVDAEHAYQRLDPATLEPMAGESIAFESEYQSAVVSADGSTSVMIDSSKQATLDGWIVVYDGMLQRERLAIDVDEEVWDPRLSADGSRVTLRTQIMCGPYGCDPLTWYTYDTDSGELISITSVDLTDYVGGAMVSSDADRLYIGYYQRPPAPSDPATRKPPGSRETGPWPLRIAAFDLDTGEEIGRMTVPGVMAGSWQIEPSDQTDAGEYITPAIALSPDGAAIAVVDAGMTTLTLIDAGSLSVTATRDIHERESTASRALRWLGILPGAAQAKVAQGRSVSATFSPDGEGLYLTGEEIGVGDTVDDVTGRGFGVLRVDVGSGEITARSLDGHHPSTILPSPDGRSLYVLRPAVPWWESVGGPSDFILYRLDAATLEPLVERTLDERTLLLLVPEAG
jgi:hypothetical protein